MIDGFHTAAALRRQRSRELLMSPQVRHLLEQSERAFRLARAMTNRADAEGLGQVGRLLLDEARRLAAEEGAPIKCAPR